MIKFLAATGIMASVIGFSNCVNIKPTMTQSEKTHVVTGKWTKLFDGKTLKGWHTYGKANVGNVWKVEDGALVMDPSSSKDPSQKGDLVTDQEFENFHLQLEWKISEGGNSGIMFYVNEDLSKYKRPYNTGPEMQVLDNNKHPDAKIHKHRAGDLYDLIASSEETVKPVGEWNKAEIVANNGKLDFYLNGKNIVSTTMWDDKWRDMLSKSKFSTMPGFGTYKKGKIVLQDHGDKVWYRNIKIKEL